MSTGEGSNASRGVEGVVVHDDGGFDGPSRSENGGASLLRFCHFNDVYHVEYVPSHIIRRAGLGFLFGTIQMKFLANALSVVWSDLTTRSGSAEPVGGVARFQSVVKQYRRSTPELIMLFSGDAFNPSLESSVTKGQHMVPVLNGIGTAVACVGVSMQISTPQTLAGPLC